MIENQRPKYLNFDDEKLKEFLSRADVYLPKELVMVQMLGKYWSKVIDWNIFTEQAKVQTRDQKSILIQLMKKLRKHALGLIVNMLSDQGESAFQYHSD